MPHIKLPEGMPGIIGPLTTYPQTGKPLSHLTEVLLRGDSTLSRAERELIAAHVSSGNDCYFCAQAHGAVASHHLGGDRETVRQVWQDFERAPVSDKMKALLNIAGKVRVSGKQVTESDVERARNEGASDKEIHDTVLIAAAFCMFNRYVDGLATWTPREDTVYEQIGDRLAHVGYEKSVQR